MNILTILPLTQGWMYPFFSKLRSEMVANSGCYKSIILGLAVLFVGFNLIKVIISITSDDNKSGFGDLTLHDLVRPFILIAAILAYGPIAGFFDNLVNSVTVSIAYSVQQQTPSLEEEYDKAVKLVDRTQTEMFDNYKIDENNDYATRIRALADSVSKAAKVHGYDVEEKQRELEELAKKNGYKPNQANFLNNLFHALAGAGNNQLVSQTAQVEAYTPMQYLESKEGIAPETLQKAKELSEAIKSGTDFRNDFRQKFEQLNEETSKLKRGRNLLPILVNWLFDKLYIIIECLAELYLVVLCFMGPIALALSILSNWKDTWKSYISKYVEISLWKIIAAIIAYTVYSARIIAAEFTIENITNTLMVTGNFADLQIMSTWSVKAFFSVAGLIALLKIPSLTSTLVGLAGGGVGGLSGGLSEVRQEVHSVASGTAKTADKIFGGGANKEIIGLLKDIKNK